MNTSNFIRSWLNLYDILYGTGQCKRNYFRVQLKSKHQTDQRTALFNIICFH